MHEPSDGIAEEVERQLQLALAAAAIAARRAIAARGQALEQARRDSDQAARAAQARIDAERLLATERLRPVFDDAWWETAGPHEIADMWGEANSWRDPAPAPRSQRSSTTPPTGSARRCTIAAGSTRPKSSRSQPSRSSSTSTRQAPRPPASSPTRRPPRKTRRARSTTRGDASSSAPVSPVRTCPSLPSRRERSPISPKPARPWRRHALPPWPQRSRDAPPATARHENSHAAGESRDLGWSRTAYRHVVSPRPVGVAC